MDEKRVKIGCHDFLNSKPLSYPLTRIEDNPFQVIFESPARLASMLAARELDLALIPSIEYARQDGLKIIGDFSISSLGPVDTVLLFSRKNIRETKSIAVDSSSRTSVAMLRIILEEKFQISPEFITCDPCLDRMLELAEGALIIGDNAFNIGISEGEVYDLGREWYDLSARPFVHALLAVSPEVTLSSRELGALKDCFGFAAENQYTFENIVRDEARRLMLDKGVVRDYLTVKIRYSLNEPELDGLKHFFQLSKKYDLIKTVPEIKFYD